MKVQFRAKPPGLEFLANRRDELFPDGVVSGSVLVSNVAFGAAALGVGHVEIKDHLDWWFVASESNWLMQGLPAEHSVLRLFEEVIPFPELSPTSYRPEIDVTVFAQQAYLDLDGEVTYLFGECPLANLPHRGVVPGWCRYVLGFKL